MGLIKEVARGWRWGHRPLVPRSVEPPVGDHREFPTDWARTDAAKMARAAILRFGFRPLIRRDVDVEVHGLDRLAQLDSPVIFVANHSSHLDAPLVLTSLPPDWRDNIAVGAAADYFFDVWWRAVGTTLAFNTFPVERAGVRKSSGLGKKLLEEGWNLLVFPEGTRSPDGWMREFKHGTAHLAMASGAPVVPIAIRGSYQAMPKGRGWPTPGRPPVSVRFGSAVFAGDGEDVHSLTARIRSALTVTLAESESTWWEAIRQDSVPDFRGPDAARWRRMWESSRPLERKTKVWS